MSTDLAQRGVPFAYEVEKAPKKTKQKDWTAGIIQPWVVMDAEEVVAHQPLADYVEALQFVRMASPDEDHCDRRSWVRIGTPKGIVEQAGPRIGLRSPDIQDFHRTKAHDALGTSGHSSSHSGGRGRLLYTQNASGSRVAGARATAAATLSKKHVIQITGELLDRDQGRLRIDWYGGDKISVSVSDTVGFEAMSPGDWFKAVIVRLSNGDVEQALLVQTVEPPEVMSEEELADVYSQLPAADLEPTD